MPREAVGSGEARVLGGGEDAKSCDYPESQTQHKRMCPPSPPSDYPQSWWQPARCAAVGERASPSPGAGWETGSFWKILGPILLPNPSSSQVLRPKTACTSRLWNLLVEGSALRYLPCISGLSLSGIQPSFLASERSRRLFIWTKCCSLCSFPGNFDPLLGVPA